MPNTSGSTCEQVRPFVVFALTGGLVTATVFVGLERYFLALVIGVSGCAAAILLGITAKVIDMIYAFEYKPKKTRDRN